MFCGISGSVPKEPVVSKTSGHVFERSLIEKYIASEGTNPKTGAPMEADDLLPLVGSTSVAPRPASASSIPGLLGMMQTEWDALVLQNFELTKQLETTRRELAQALFQSDAANRVIARLIKERDDARAALAAGGGGKAAAGNGSAAMDVDQSGSASGPLSAALAARLSKQSEELTAGRRGRKKRVKGHAIEEYAKLAQTSSHKPHKTNPGGVLCVDTHASQTSLVVTGGADKALSVFDRAQGKVVHGDISGHSKKVVDVRFHPTAMSHDAPVIFSASEDGTVRTWRASADTSSRSGKGKARKTAGAVAYAEVASIAVGGGSGANAAKATSLCPNPDGSIVAAAASDGTMGLWDTATADQLVAYSADGSSCVAGARAATKGKAKNGAKGVVCFQPDGVLLVHGRGKEARLWDVRAAAPLATLGGLSGNVQCLSFSENGVLAAFGDDSNTLSVFDLRKIDAGSVPLAKSSDLGSPVLSVDFDFSGAFVAAGTAAGSISVTHVKKWTQAATLEDASGKSICGLAFSKDAPGSFLAAASLDKTLAFYAVA